MSEEWRARLAPAFEVRRRHHGIMYFGADEDAHAPRGTVVAAWEDQNGQWDMVVVRL
jgi:hypothetical protein